MLGQPGERRACPAWPGKGRWETGDAWGGVAAEGQPRQRSCIEGTDGSDGRHPGRMEHMRIAGPTCGAMPSRMARTACVWAVSGVTRRESHEAPGPYKTNPSNLVGLVA